MLQVAFIKNNKEIVLAGLAKRNFANAEEIIDEIISVDQQRRNTQSELDNALAESNKLSKEIGQLFKAGEPQKATILKEKTSELKEESKKLSEAYNSLSNQLQELLYQVPNIPHSSVPSGSSEDDNEVVFEEGNIPTLSENALLGWSPAR